MNLPEWAKQIRPDSSIQALHCDTFVSQSSIKDCVIVGHSSLRILVYNDSQQKISILYRYDHPEPIISSCIAYRNEKPEICFISTKIASNQKHLYFIQALPDKFVVTKNIQIDGFYFNVICSPTKVLLYSNSQNTILLSNIDDLQFLKIRLECKNIISCTFLAEVLIVLLMTEDFKFYTDVYEIKKMSLDLLFHVNMNSRDYWKLLGFNSHNMVYVLGDKFQMKLISQAQIINKWKIELPEGNIPNDILDPFLVDAAPIGQKRLLLLTEGGDLILYDGITFSKPKAFFGASAIGTLSLERYIIAINESRLVLIDKNFEVLDEINDAVCTACSYSSGHFNVVSHNSVHMTLYDYSIEIEKCAPLKSNSLPRLIVNQDIFFILYTNKTIVIDNTFRDITPSVVRKRGFERIHSNSYRFFYGINRETVSVIDHGSIKDFNEVSTLSCHRLYTLYLAELDIVKIYLYCHSTLILQNKYQFESQISCMTTTENGLLCVSLFDNTILTLSDDLKIINKVLTDKLVISMVKFQQGIAAGTGEGSIIYYDSHFIFESQQDLGTSSVHLSELGNQLTAQCGNRFYMKKKQRMASMPYGIIELSAFGLLKKTFVAIITNPNKANSYYLIQFHFTNESYGLHNNLILTVSSDIPRICCSRSKNEFVCYFREHQTLYWSRDDFQFKLNNNEKIKSLIEWKAKFKEHSRQFWMIATAKNGEGTLYLFTRAQNKMSPSLKKTFKPPVISCAASTTSVAFFLQDNTIFGISLENGALTKKTQVKTDFKYAYKIDATNKYVVVTAVLHNPDPENIKTQFAVYSLDRDYNLTKVPMNPNIIAHPITKPIAKIANDFVAIYGSQYPKIYIYSISPEINIIREVELMSPITSIFPFKELIFCCCACGDMYLISCTGRKVVEADVNRLFSFGHCLFALDE